jgi:hypothetical protein
LTGVSNGVLLITNVFFIYNVWSAYWRIAIKLPYLQALTIVSLIVASIDIVYRLILLKWCVEKVVTGKNFTGIRNTEAPPKIVPIYLPICHRGHLDGAGNAYASVPVYDIEIREIHHRKLCFRGRPYNKFPLMFIPPGVIVFVPDQPHIYQNHNRMGVEVIVVHYIHGYVHLNQLVDMNDTNTAKRESSSGLL